MVALEGTYVRCHLHQRWDTTAATATTTIIQNGTAADQASVTSHRLQTNDEIKGFTGNNFADVTSDNQLLTTTTDPSAFVNSSFVEVIPASGVPIVGPPSGLAMVVTTIHVDTFADPTPGPGNDILVDIQPGTTCPFNAQVGSYSELVNPPADGETDIPFNPGLALPAGDVLCAESSGPQVFVTVTGYLVPSNEVPARVRPIRVRK